MDLLLEELISPHSGSLLSSIIYEMAEESIAAIDSVGNRDCSFFGDTFSKLFHYADVGLNELSSSEVAQLNGPL